MATRKERKMAGSGGRLVAIGLPLVVIGLALALILESTASGIGVAIAVLGSLPVVAGVVLLLSSGTEKHARKDRPFA